MKIRVVVPFLLGVPLASSAQRISGVVRATGTQAPMSEVASTLLDSVQAAVAQAVTDQSGRFNSEDDLRRNDNRALSDIIRNYAPGVRLISAPEMPPDLRQFFALNLSGVECYTGSNVPLPFKNLRNPCTTWLLGTRGQ